MTDEELIFANEAITKLAASEAKAQALWDEVQDLTEKLIAERKAHADCNSAVVQWTNIAARQSLELGKLKRDHDMVSEFVLAHMDEGQDTSKAYIALAHVGFMATLLERNAKLRAALKPFADEANNADERWSDESLWKPMLVGDLRRARAALKGE